MYHYQILSPGKSFSPPSDGGAVGVPHTPEGAQKGDLLGPAGASPGNRVLVLIEDPELGDTAAALDRESIPRVQSGHFTSWDHGAHMAGHRSGPTWSTAQHQLRVLTELGLGCHCRRSDQGPVVAAQADSVTLSDHSATWPPPPRTPSTSSSPPPSTPTLPPGDY